MDDNGNVRKLNIKFKSPTAGGPMLKIVSPWEKGECRHRDVQYLIREGETEVECGACHAKLDPMFIIKILASQESQWMETAKRYKEEMARLNARTRTQCRNCGKMTKISRS